MKAFKSKVGYGILIPVLILLVGTALLPLYYGAPIVATLLIAVSNLLVMAFAVHMFWSTTYRINDQGELLIKCGFLYHKVIKISSIRSVRESRSIMASPATSLDRLELKYGKWDSVLISPRNKWDFINELLRINPEIQHSINGYAQP